MPMFWSCLDILITMRFSINCSIVICSPTVEFTILREATSETYGIGSTFHHINLPSTSYFCRSLFLQSLLSNLYNKNTKNIYLIIFIRSHFCKWSWRDWQPLYRVGCKVLICLFHKHIIIDPACLRCRTLPEDASHLLISCPYAGQRLGITPTSPAIGDLWDAQLPPATQGHV